MATTTYTKIASGSLILNAMGGIFGELGAATGSDTLQSIGSVASRISALGVNVAAAGQYATSDQAGQAAALLNAGPIVAAIAANRGTAPAAVTPPTPKSTASVPPGPGAGTQAMAGGGVLDTVFDLLAVPFKLLGKLAG